MTSVIRSAIAAGVLSPVRKSRERLYTSRAMRDFSESDVYVLALQKLSTPDPTM
jgi:hypothetical protein